MTKYPVFVILGTGGFFTYHVVNTLFDNSYYPAAYIQSGQKLRYKPSTFTDIELEINKRPNNLFELLQSRSIPCKFEREINISQFILELNTDFLLVACWPNLLRNKIIKAPAKASLNLHPSLLPKFRGIDPITDQLNSLDDHFGISLHLINEQFDTGDIVLQRSLDILPDSSRLQIEQMAAIRGAKLFIQALQTYQNPGWSLTEQNN
jgi:methionyl-tRNA formyltransferase